MRLKICEALGNRNVKSAYGPIFRANYADVTFKLYITGSYGDFYWINLKSIDADFYFLDIGANQGLYSIGAAANPFCQRVLAFEPVSKTADLLLCNTAINGFSGKIAVYKNAISNVNGTLKMTVNPSHSGAASLESAHAADNASDFEDIQAINHLGLNALPLDNESPIYVKIDVEGHEYAVLFEIFKTRFASRIKQIFYEVDNRWVNPQKLASTVEKQGFSIRKIGRGKVHYDVLAEREI